MFALASAMYGLVASGIGLLNESILVERGFTPSIYYQALAVTAITGLLGNFAAGALAGRTSLRTILVTALLVLAAGLAALAHVTTVAHVMAQAVAMGVAGGFIMVVFFAFWGQGLRTRTSRTHPGCRAGADRRRSAVGPLFLAMWSEATGSYAVAFYVLAVVVAALADRGRCGLGPLERARPDEAAVFGASGKTGREVVRQALARGFHVTAFVRETARLPLAHANLRWRQGRAHRSAAVAKVMSGHTGVISTLGVGSRCARSNGHRRRADHRPRRRASVRRAARLHVVHRRQRQP